MTSLLELAIPPLSKSALAEITSLPRLDPHVVLILSCHDSRDLSGPLSDITRHPDRPGEKEDKTAPVMEECDPVGTHIHSPGGRHGGDVRDSTEDLFDIPSDVSTGCGCRSC